ncbi:hypothetical protein BDY17DRAFT_296349 [Neohortaea acidophila]|uniref:Uncharacterized protein n=1 Tax=Neohortaea acidophila TaxID=245834 RepID=A0A6A6PRV1_9PEZI|nr:uncharacterized protein BDY17DRAFT_296349 [Neohortaea acidophila]KAF2482858.1 hypothetical protein BDY17DRAFT_296349 [Neohortaea acidophila]
MSRTTQIGVISSLPATVAARSTLYLQGRRGADPPVRVLRIVFRNSCEFRLRLARNCRGECGACVGERRGAVPAGATRRNAHRALGSLYI